MTLRLSSFLLTFALAFTPARAQLVEPEQHPADYGGLASYPVPVGEGSGNELNYCVLYAKRAWRVGLDLAARRTTLSSIVQYVNANLGKSAARVEIADFERLQSGEYLSPADMGAYRFIRCTTQLKLPTEPRHKQNAEYCFKTLWPLDLAAQLRANGKTKEQVLIKTQAAAPNLPTKLLESTVALAFTGPTVDRDDSLISKTFLSCLAYAGEHPELK